MRLVRLAALAGAVWYLRDAHRRQQLLDRIKGLLGRGEQRAPGSEQRFESQAATPSASETQPRPAAAQTPSG